MGDTVWVTASSEVTLEECERIYKPLGVESLFFDLAKPEMQSTKLQTLLETEIEAVVFNAAPETRMLKRLHEFSSEEVASAMNTNISGNFWILKNILPQLMKNKFGRLVFISSIGAMGGSRYPVYATYKSALEGMFLSIANDYGEFDITANILRLGVMRTKRTERFWKRTDYMQGIGQAIPLKKLGSPESAAEAIQVFLTRECYVTGATLHCTGGLPLVRSEAFFKTGV